MKILQKISLQHLAVLFFLLFIFLVPFFVFASPASEMEMQANGGEGVTKSLLNNLADSAGYEKERTVGDVLSASINGFFGLIGAIFLIYIIYSGYLWMGAPGEEQVKKAKDQIRNAIWGIIIVIGSYAIVNFVLKALFIGGS